jgi:hypothetical protein
VAGPRSKPADLQSGCCIAHFHLPSHRRRSAALPALHAATATRAPAHAVPPSTRLTECTAAPLQPLPPPTAAHTSKADARRQRTTPPSAHPGITLSRPPPPSPSRVPPVARTSSRKPRHRISTGIYRPSAAVHVAPIATSAPGAPLCRLRIRSFWTLIRHPWFLRSCQTAPTQAAASWTPTLGCIVRDIVLLNYPPPALRLRPDTCPISLPSIWPPALFFEGLREIGTSKRRVQDDARSLSTSTRHANATGPHHGRPRSRPSHAAGHDASGRIWTGRPCKSSRPYDGYAVGRPQCARAIASATPAGAHVPTTATTTAAAATTASWNA